MTTPRWIYHFDEYDRLRTVAPDRDSLLALLGRAGAQAAELLHLGVPTPPGFTVTTTACRAYWEAGQQWPAGLREQLQKAVDILQVKTGKRLGDPHNPLLLRCGVSTKYPAPGLMDTLIYIGLDQATSAGLVDLTGDAGFVYGRYLQLLKSFGCGGFGMPWTVFDDLDDSIRSARGVSSVLDLDVPGWKQLMEATHSTIEAYIGMPFPQDPRRQLELAVEKDFASWINPRAVGFRAQNGIPDDPPPAVVVSAVMLGNLGQDSACGVAWTRDDKTGDKSVSGKYILNAAGDAPVRDSEPTAHSIEDLPPALFQELVSAARAVERFYGAALDLSFTIERGQLWILGGPPDRRPGDARATAPGNPHGELCRRASFCTGEAGAARQAAIAGA